MFYSGIDLHKDSYFITTINDHGEAGAGSQPARATQIACPPCSVAGRAKVKEHYSGD